MNRIRKFIRKLLFKLVYQQWNIAIAEVGEDFIPVNIRWMKHDYTDRWFADPFIVDESRDSFIILAEEYMRDTSKGRLVRLTLSKTDCRLRNNEIILDMPTHLSFPNFIDVDGTRYIYPENSAFGKTLYYEYNSRLLQNQKVLFPHPIADPVICHIDDKYYLLYTDAFECNGNKLQVCVSGCPLSGYTHFQTIEFADNVARRAGNIFVWNGSIISPAQVSNNDYGEGISLQELSINNGRISLKEFARLSPPTKQYSKGFHTYNVYKNYLIIDGYRYGSDLLHMLYFFIRRFI